MVSAQLCRTSWAPTVQATTWNHWSLAPIAHRGAYYHAPMFSNGTTAPLSPQGTLGSRCGPVHGTTTLQARKQQVYILPTYMQNKAEAGMLRRTGMSHSDVATPHHHVSPFRKTTRRLSPHLHAHATHPNPSLTFSPLHHTPTVPFRHFHSTILLTYPALNLPTSYPPAPPTQPQINPPCPTYRNQQRSAAAD